jgi:hypothetical protein
MDEDYWADIRDTLIYRLATAFVLIGFGMIR